MACDMTIALLERNRDRLLATIEHDGRKLETYSNFSSGRKVETLLEKLKASINHNSELIADIEIAIKILKETNLVGAETDGNPL